MIIVAIKDVETGDYTAFHTQFPSVVIQTDSLEAVPQKLSNAFHDIMMGSKIEEYDSKYRC